MKEKILRNFFGFAKPTILTPGVMHTAESNFSNFVIEYLGEMETEFENTLACLSGAQIGLNHEKMEVDCNRYERSRNKFLF